MDPKNERIKRLSPPEDLQEATTAVKTEVTKKFSEIRIGVLLTPDDVAKKLRIEKKTIYNLVSQGKLKAIKINGKLLRFTEADIDRWISSQRGESNVD